MQKPQPSARGDFGKTPFVHLLIYALERKLTGSLELTAPPGKVSALTLVEGQVTNARTSEPVAFLGRVLLELGFVSDDVLNQTLLELAKTKRLHGQLLLARGLLTEAQLKVALRVQLVRKVRHMVELPRETQFAFYDGFDVLQGYGGEAIAVADPLPLVWRALVEAPPWEHVSHVLSRAQSNRFRVLATANLARFEFEKDIAPLVERLRAKPMTVSELSALGLTSPRLTQLLVYCLVVTKQIEVAETLTSSAPPPAMRPSSPPLRPRVAQSDVRPVAAIPRPAAVPTFGARHEPAHVASAREAGTRGAGTREEAAKPLSSEMQARLEEVKARAAGIDKQDYFEMLGVPRTSTAEEVKNAYFALAKKWHPDRLPRELDAVRDECARVFSRFGEASSTLTHEEQRNRYMRLLSEGGATPDEQETIATVIEATQNFQKAEVFLKRNDLPQAETLVRKAHVADPKQADYLALLAWVESQRPENQSPKATQERVAMLDRAVQMNANCEKAHFYRAMLHKRLGNDRQAARDFRRAADLNPRNLDAAREVRLFEMRKGRPSTAPPPSGPGSPAAGPAPADKSSLIGKLFKR